VGHPVTDREEDGPATARGEYADRLVRLESAWWKRALDVQRPYRWNLRRLEPRRTLDVGCGVGRNLQNLPDAVGVDHNAQSVQVARSRGLTAWTTAEWPTCRDALPASFDTLLIAHVLEHLDVEDADDVIRQYLDYVRPDGRLLLICPQERGYASDETHVRFVDADELAATARRHGFRPTRSYSFPFPRIVGRAFAYNEFVLVADRAR